MSGEASYTDPEVVRAISATLDAEGRVNDPERLRTLLDSGQSVLSVGEGERLDFWAARKSLSGNGP